MRRHTPCCCCCHTTELLLHAFGCFGGNTGPWQWRHLGLGPLQGRHFLPLLLILGKYHHHHLQQHQQQQKPPEKAIPLLQQSSPQHTHTPRYVRVFGFANYFTRTQYCVLRMNNAKAAFTTTCRGPPALILNCFFFEILLLHLLQRCRSSLPPTC